MPSMTRAQGRANRAGNPSLCDQWIASTLRALAMLVSIVARLVRLPHQTQTAECDGDPAQTPEARDVLGQFREATTTATTRKQQRNSRKAAPPRSAPTQGLTLRTIEQAIVDSKGEAGFTGPASEQQQQQYLRYRSAKASRAL
jgi:hypothetical protein